MSVKSFYVRVFFIQGKFSSIPSVFVTSVHYHAGLKRDAASVWVEDVTQSSFKICLRELQNYAGLHKDVYVVSRAFFSYLNLPEVRYLHTAISVPVFQLTLSG